ncbi:MAG TPA: hypothetical protein DHU96_00045, partial [Actinobacteria bacterium]|nr:hypothetical protein [Actinomycetota bacterium]
FFPLTVDYQERTYSAGKIPGGFFKREARLSDREILVCRFVLGERELILALECLGSRVRLIVARPADGVTQPLGDLRLGLGDVRGEAGDLRPQLLSHLLQLRLGPGLLPRAHGKSGCAGTLGCGHILPPSARC